MNSIDINITPGRIIALWRVLIATNSHEGEKIEDIYRAMSNHSVMGGGLPLKSGIQIGIDYGFLIPRNNKFFLSDYAKQELIPICSELEPSYKALRGIYYHIIRTKLVPWIIYFNLDVELFKISIPNNWLQLLTMADLLNFSDLDVKNWWHLVINTKSAIDEAKLKKIGDIGEKLTYDFEIKRLLEDKISEVDNKVIWVSQISDEYGFDILSISGSLFNHDSKDDNVFIEVKASEVSNPNIFSFFITENEWKQALARDNHYFFYCWPGIKPQSQSSSFELPHVVASCNILSLLPINTTKQSQWVKCRVTINLSELSINT